MSPSSLPAAALLVVLGACTTLGPTPTTTGFTAVPAARPDVEVQAGATPGYYLSSAVIEEPKGAAIGQLAASFEPDRLIGVPGLIIGARAFGQSGDALFEPVLGYRHALGDGQVSLAGFVYGTTGSAAKDGASYEASRFGAELASDIRLSSTSKTAEVHLFGGAAVTGVSADGTYCVDGQGQYGAQCPDDGSGTMRTTHASGAYPALHLGLAANLFKHRAGAFHGARIAAMFAAGAMPRVVDATQTDATAFFTIGLNGSLAFGGE